MEVNNDDYKKVNFKLWRDLFEVWLKSIGCENFEGDGFYYKNARYKTWLAPRLDIGVWANIWSKSWANINLDIRNIDVCDPSFKPDEFFAPFKEWLDARTE